jgi:hypothetical protein
MEEIRITAKNHQPDNIGFLDQEQLFSPIPENKII